MVIIRNNFVVFIELASIFKENLMIHESGWFEKGKLNGVSEKLGENGRNFNFDRNPLSPGKSPPNLLNCVCG